LLVCAAQVETPFPSYVKLVIMSNSLTVSQ